MFRTSYIAAVDIPRNSLVKFGNTDDTVTLATAGTDLTVGVTDNVDVKAGAMVDVLHIGTAEVKFNGAVVRGANFTSDANGKAVAVKDGDISVGFALRTASAGDIKPAAICRK